MIKKIILFLLIFLALAFGVKSAVQVPLVFHTGIDPDSGDSLYIQVQVAKDSLFTQLADTSIWLQCGQNVDFTYNTTLPDNIPSQLYFWRGRHKDTKNHLTAWSPFYRFTLRINQPPSGCACISPSNGAVIDR